MVSGERMSEPEPAVIDTLKQAEDALEAARLLMNKMLRALQARSVRDGRYKLIENLLTDRPNPARGVDGCAAWAASQKSEYDGTDVRRAYDTYRRPPSLELYDLEQDPHEFHNLAEVPEYKGTLQRLKARLDAWRAATDDPLLAPEALAELTRQDE